MTGKSLSNISDEATELVNTVGVLDPILRISPEDGLVLQLLNQVAVGDELGIPISAKLRSAQGTQLPRGTDLAIGYKQPGDDSFSVVSEVQDNIEVFRLLDLTEQRETDKIDQTKLRLKENAPRLTAAEYDEILVLVESSEQINWDYSRLQFNPAAVNELSMSAAGFE